MRRLGWIFTLAAVSIGLGACATSLPARGEVVGGIRRCGALGVPGPRYVAGTVTLLRGQVTWRTIGPGTSQAVFPSAKVASQTVGTEGLYQFQLDPGTYVLRGQYIIGNVQPFTSVVVKPASQQGPTSRTSASRASPPSLGSVARSGRYELRQEEGSMQRVGWLVGIVIAAALFLVIPARVCASVNHAWNWRARTPTRCLFLETGNGQAT